MGAVEKRLSYRQVLSPFKFFQLSEKNFTMLGLKFSVFVLSIIALASYVSPGCDRECQKCMSKCPKKNGFFDFRPNAHGCGNYHCKGPNGEPKVNCGCAKCDHGCPHKCNKWGLCPGTKPKASKPKPKPKPVKKEEWADGRSLMSN